MIVVLIQAGRGGGLVEGFTGVESMFGTKTNAFLTRTTTVLSILFFITCLTLAVLSSRQGKSLMGQVKVDNTPVAESSTAEKKENPVTAEMPQNQPAAAPLAPVETQDTDSATKAQQ
jgi:protein translocase SecG subunit